MKVIRLFILSLLFLLVIQACSNGVIDEPQKNNVNMVESKKLINRFSTENMKLKRESFYQEKRAELKNLSSSTKANQEISANNIYLMVIPASKAGSSSIPGFSQSELKNVKCKSEAMQGFGDTVYGKNHLLYRKELLQFMYEFNRLMKPYCK